ncbi:MAG: hypothetical protein C0631_16275 [Sedimenticola sp.]|jgi:hypothetical protein|nr:MAG: hypothetical protein C0631_16275 [Sedimenticola sp.]
MTGRATVSIATASICLAVLTILRHVMISHSLAAIRPVSHLMDTISLAERIGKPSHCTLQWDQPHQQSKQNSQQFIMRLAHTSKYY